MMCFRDMSFCSDAPQCAARSTCPRHFDDAQWQADVRWWGGEGAPVAYMSFRRTCPQYVEVHNENQNE